MILIITNKYRLIFNTGGVHHEISFYGGTGTGSCKNIEFKLINDLV